MRFDTWSVALFPFQAQPLKYENDNELKRNLFV